MPNNIEQVITEAADKLMKAVEAYGPKATSLVLETGRIAAMQDIACGIAFLFVLAIALGIGVFCIRQISKLAKFDDAKIGWGVGTAGCGLAAVIGLIGALLNLVNVFAWVGINHPEIYLAAKLLKL